MYFLNVTPAQIVKITFTQCVSTLNKGVDMRAYVRYMYTTLHVTIIILLHVCACIINSTSIGLSRLEMNIPTDTCLNGIWSFCLHTPKVYPSSIWVHIEHTHTRARAHTHTHTHRCTHIQIHTNPTETSYTCTYAHTHTHTHTRTHNTYIHTRTHAHTHTYIHIHTYIHTYIHTHIHTQTYTRISCTYICTYIHTHTHTHTYTQQMHHNTYVHILHYIMERLVLSDLS